MSRIGKLAVAIPSGVIVEVNGTHIKVSGKNGILERDLRPELAVRLEGGQVICCPKDEKLTKKSNAYWGLSRSLIHNLIVGVNDSFSQALVVEGIGYRVSISGTTLSLNVGYSEPVDFELPQGISAEVSKDNVITLKGMDKTLLGLTAARVRAVRPVEPYKGKGIRYVDERVIRKAGKTGGKK